MLASSQALNKQSSNCSLRLTSNKEACQFVMERVTQKAIFYSFPLGYGFV
jgi:hypothetical protein